jgi:hypothetical protein
VENLEAASRVGLPLPLTLNDVKVLGDFTIARLERRMYGQIPRAIKRLKVIGERPRLAIRCLFLKKIFFLY